MSTLFARLRQAIRHTARHAFNLFLPATCPSCQLPLPPSEPIAFCATCYAKMPWWNTAQILPPQLPPAIASFAAPCLYEEPLRSAILNLKFHRALPYAAPLAHLLLPHLPASPMLIIPVPSHPSRTRQRHYNHVLAMAYYLAKHTAHRVHPTALKRVRKEAPQSGKTRAARLKLPASAFRANPKLIHDQHILLLDDIYTTGATARACALALRKAGAASVHVRTLAYTPPR